MQGRPPSSGRPSTSARPSTAFDRDHFQQRLQQQPYEIEEEYEEDSDDDNVFAFVPPTTADQEKQRSQSPFTNSPFAVHSNGVQYPEPAFDPWGRYPTLPAATSSKNPFPVSTADTNTQSYTISPPLNAGSQQTSPPPAHGVLPHHHPHPHNQPPISPPSPSTDSHPSTGMTGPDFYRLKRMGTAVSSKLGVEDKAQEKEDDKENEKEQERNGGDTRKGEEKRLDADADANEVHKDKEGDDSDAATREKDVDNVTSRRRSLRRRRTLSSQDFQHVLTHENPNDVDTERDAGLYRQSITTTIASASKGKRNSRISEGGGTKPNQNALPYKMYNQQASSYYGRDVRTGGASVVSGMWSFFFNFFPFLFN